MFAVFYIHSPEDARLFESAKSAYACAVGLAKQGLAPGIHHPSKGTFSLRTLESMVESDEPRAGKIADALTEIEELGTLSDTDTGAWLLENGLAISSGERWALTHPGRNLLGQL